MIKWILTVLLFSTTPQNITPEQMKDHDLFEQRHIWTLQSTTTNTFSSFDACYAAGEQFEDLIFPVGTMTLRYWCVCDGDENTCASENAKVQTTLTKLLVEKKDDLRQMWTAEENDIRQKIKDKVLKPAAGKKQLDQIDAIRTARLKWIDEILDSLKAPPSKGNVELFSLVPGEQGARAPNKPSNFRVVPLYPVPR